MIDQLSGFQRRCNFYFHTGLNAIKVVGFVLWRSYIVFIHVATREPVIVKGCLVGSIFDKTFC